VRRLRLGEEKREERRKRKKESTGQNYNGPLLHRTAIKSKLQEKQKYRLLGYNSAFNKTKLHCASGVIIYGTY